MTKSNIKWAEQHDWYLGASLKNGIYSVTVLCSETLSRITFNNFDELTLWAGY